MGRRRGVNKYWLQYCRVERVDDLTIGIAGAVLQPVNVIVVLRVVRLSFDAMAGTDRGGGGGGRRRRGFFFAHATVDLAALHDGTWVRQADADRLRRRRFAARH